MDNKVRMAPVNVRINPLGGAVCIVFLLCTFVYMFGLPEWLGRREERVSMKELLSAGIVLARRGGDRVREIRRHNSLEERVKGETAEGAKEMVSQGDMESHRTIVHGFNKAFPGLMVTLFYFSIFFFFLFFIYIIILFIYYIFYFFFYFAACNSVIKALRPKWHAGIIFLV